MIPYRPRWLNHAWAQVAGYFWLPCPRCGEMFGGHEEGGVDKQLNGHGKMTCPLCPETRTFINGEWVLGDFVMFDGRVCQVVPV